MADEPGRRASDVALAHEIAEKLWPRLEELAQRHGAAPEDRALAFVLFRELITDVWQRLDLPPVPLPPERGAALVADLEAAIRVSRFYAEAGVRELLMLRGPNDAFDAGVLIDVFSDTARKSLGVDEGPRADEPSKWPNFAAWVARLRDRKDVVPVERAAAQRQFLAPFTDSVRAVARIFSGGGTSSVSFTVTSGHGYVLDWYPRYRYRPVVFGGGTLSSPVSGTLAVGHYCFQGRMGSGAAIRDPGSHYAGPSSTSTRLTAF
jgi:hypothetical protein